MKKNFLFLLLSAGLLLTACGGKKETPASVAQQWCDLNAKAHKAEGPAKEAAEQEREKFEKKMEEKYKGDKDFLSKVQKEVEKCEDASEGRN